jgi:hypothetical protein
MPHFHLSHPTWFGYINNIWWSSPFCDFLHCAITLYFIGSDIPVSTLFSNIIHLYSFFKVRDQVSYQWMRLVENPLSFEGRGIMWLAENDA